MTDERLFICKVCGHELRNSEPRNIYTGVAFDAGFTWVCAKCRGDMYELKDYEPGQFVSECDKVLSQYK